MTAALLGLSHDPVAGGGDQRTKPLGKYIFADTILIVWTWFLFAIRYVFTVGLLWQRQDQDRFLFLPAKYLQRMRDSALADLASQSTGDSEKLPILSCGDILFAW
jgi:hypothetical protein